MQQENDNAPNNQDDKDENKNSSLQNDVAAALRRQPPGPTVEQSQKKSVTRDINCMHCGGDGAHRL